jgi:hypothetical protein
LSTVGFLSALLLLLQMGRLLFSSASAPLPYSPAIWYPIAAGVLVLLTAPYLVWVRDGSRSVLQLAIAQGIGSGMRLVLFLYALTVPASFVGMAAGFGGHGFVMAALLPFMAAVSYVQLYAPGFSGALFLALLAAQFFVVRLTRQRMTARATEPNVRWQRPLGRLIGVSLMIGSCLVTTLVLKRAADANTARVLCDPATRARVGDVWRCPDR